MNGKGEVWHRVESFREQYLVGPLQHLPVDVFTLVELELRLDVIPFDDLFAKYQVDAALIQDFSGIYVDAESYILWEKGPNWKQNRLRFSVAHELGHFVLHRELAEQHEFTSFAAFKLWINSQSSIKYSLEQEANEFAGRLLVPRGTLEQGYQAFAAQVGTILPRWRFLSDIRRSFADSIAARFGVNAQVIEVRLDREEIWPEINF